MLDKTTALQIKAVKTLMPAASYNAIAQAFGNVVTRGAIRNLCIGNIHSDLPAIKSKAAAREALGSQADAVIQAIDSAAAEKQERRRESAGKPKLSDSLALVFRAHRVRTGETFSQIAKHYGNICTGGSVRHICKGRIYTHVPQVESEYQAGMILRAWVNRADDSEALDLDTIDPVLTHRGRATKFRTSTVLAIRAADGTQRQIADKFGLACSTVSDIRNRKMFAAVEVS